MMIQESTETPLDMLLEPKLEAFDGKPLKSKWRILVQLQGGVQRSRLQVWLVLLCMIICGGTLF